jgi:hypothetical protein
MAVHDIKHRTDALKQIEQHKKVVKGGYFWQNGMRVVEWTGAGLRLHQFIGVSMATTTNALS